MKVRRNGVKGTRLSGKTQFIFLSIKKGHGAITYIDISTK
jgi:hypothetical protein